MRIHVKLTYSKVEKPNCDAFNVTISYTLFCTDNVRQLIHLKIKLFNLSTSFLEFENILDIVEGSGASENNCGSFFASL